MKTASPRNNSVSDRQALALDEGVAAVLQGAPISTISSALDRLEKRGLVVRQRRPGDRRVVHIELTSAGHRLVAKIRAQQVEVCREMLARLSADDREDLIRLVARLAQR